MKLGTKYRIIRLCVENKNRNSCRFFFFQNNAPLKLFHVVSKLCPLYNFKRVIDIVMKLGTNIKLHQTMCSEQEP